MARLYFIVNKFGGGGWDGDFVPSVFCESPTEPLKQDSDL